MCVPTFINFLLLRITQINDFTNYKVGIWDTQDVEGAVLLSYRVIVMGEGVVVKHSK
jgi:hypothetical protein